MADNSKTIKVRLEVDQNSANKAKQVLKELIQQATNLSHALAGKGGGGLGGQGLLGGGAVGGKSSLQNMQGSSTAGGQIVQNISVNSNNIKSLAKVSKDVMDKMAENVKIAARAQTNALKSLRTSIDSTALAYERLSKAAGGLSNINLPTAPAIVGPQNATVKVKGAGGARPGAGRPSNSTGTPTPKEEDSMKTFMKRLGTFAAVTAGVGTVAGELRAQPLDLTNSNARLGRTFGRSAYKTQNGDASDAMALMELQRDPNFAEDFRKVAASKGLVITQEVAKGLDPLAMITSGGASIPGAFRGINNADVTVKETVAELMEKTKESGENYSKFQNYQRFQGEAPGRLSAMRRMGMGIRTDKKGRIISNSMDDFTDKLAGGFHVDVSEVASTFSSVMATAGRRAAGQLTGIAISAVKAGMSDGAAAGMAGVAVGGRGQQVMQGLLSQTGDIEAIGKIGGYLASSMVDGSGMTSGAGYGYALSRGLTGGVQDNYIAQQNMGGVQAFGNLMGGKIDAYQSGMNTLNASRILGPNAGYSTIGALAQMSARQALDAIADPKNISGEFKSLGISGEQIQKMASATLSSIGNRGDIFDIGSAPDIASQRLDKNGFNIKDYMKKFGGKRGSDTWNAAETDIANVLFHGKGITDNFDSAMGMVRGIAEPGALNGGKGRGGVGKGSAEEANQDMINEGTKKFHQQIIGMTSELQKVAAMQDNWVKALNSMGNLSTSAQTAAENLSILAVVTDALNVDMLSKDKGRKADQLRKFIAAGTEKLEKRKADAAAKEKKQTEARVNNTSWADEVFSAMKD